MSAFRSSLRYAAAVCLASVVPFALVMAAAAAVEHYRDGRDTRVDYLLTQVHQADEKLSRLKSLMRTRAALTVHADLINAYTDSVQKLTQRVAALGDLPSSVSLNSYIWTNQGGKAKGKVGDPVVAETLANLVAGANVPRVSLQLSPPVKGSAPFEVLWKNNAN